MSTPAAAESSPPAPPYAEVALAAAGNAALSPAALPQAETLQRAPPVSPTPAALSPPSYPGSEAPPPYEDDEKSLHPRAKRLLRVAEFIATYDALLHLTIFIVVAGTPAPRTTLISAASVGFPIAYATFGWLGRIAVRRKRNSHVMAYVSTLTVRILMDLCATIYFEASRSISVFSLNPLLFIFSLLSIGLRPFFPWLFTCGDQLFLAANGFCKDAAWATEAGGETFNPHIVYAVMMLYEFALGGFMIFYYARVKRKSAAARSNGNERPVMMENITLFPAGTATAQQRTPYEAAATSSDATLSSTSVSTISTQDNQVLARILRIPEE